MTYNRLKTVNDEVDRMWKEAATAYFKVLTQHAGADGKTVPDLEANYFHVPTLWTFWSEVNFNYYSP